MSYSPESRAACTSSSEAVSVSFARAAFNSLAPGTLSSIPFIIASFFSGDKSSLANAVAKFTTPRPTMSKATFGRFSFAKFFNFFLAVMSFLAWASFLPSSASAASCAAFWITGSGESINDLNRVGSFFKASATNFSFLIYFH